MFSHEPFFIPLHFTFYIIQMLCVTEVRCSAPRSTWVQNLKHLHTLDKFSRPERQTHVILWEAARTHATCSLYNLHVLIMQINFLWGCHLVSHCLSLIWLNLVFAYVSHILHWAHKGCLSLYLPCHAASQTFYDYAFLLKLPFLYSKGANWECKMGLTKTTVWDFRDPCLSDLVYKISILLLGPTQHYF